MPMFKFGERPGKRQETDEQYSSYDEVTDDRGDLRYMDDEDRRYRDPGSRGYEDSEDREYEDRSAYREDDQETAELFLRNNPAYQDSHRVRLNQGYGSEDPDENPEEPEENDDPYGYSASYPDEYDGEALIRSEKARAEELRQRDAQRRIAAEEERKRKIREQKNRQRRLFVKKHRKGLIACAVILFVLAALFCIVLYLYESHKVTEIEVTGNTMLTDDEIIKEVCTGPLGLGRNSLYLSFKYRNREVTGIPFVEKMTVDILTPTSIRITVYEKALAGYVNYLGDNMYFTRDGTVVEASEEKVSGIPEVTGLKFDHIILGEKLPVENPDIFERILDTTQLLEKYQLDIDRIYFDSDNNLTLFYGDVRIDLGQNDYMNEKLSALSYILSKLTGRKGTIDLTNYTPDQTNITFQEFGVGSLGNLTGQENVVDGDGTSSASESGTGTDTQTGTDTGTGTDTQTGTNTGTETDTQTGTGTDTQTGTDTGTETDTQTGTDTGTGTNTQTENNTGTQADTQTGTETGNNTAQ